MNGDTRDTTVIETVGEELAMADDNNIVQVAIEVKEGEFLRVGVDFSNYEHIKSDDDSEDEDEAPFDTNEDEEEEDEKEDEFDVDEASDEEVKAYCQEIGLDVEGLKPKAMRVKLKAHLS